MSNTRVLTPYAGHDYVPFPAIRPATTQTVPVTQTSSASGALTSGVVRVVSDVAIHVAINGPASTSQLLIPAGNVEYFAVAEGDTLSVVLAATAAGEGTVWITQASAVS